MIIIDNVKENFSLHHENGILIKTWLHDEEDNEIRDLEMLLKKIIELKPEDVR